MADQRRFPLQIVFEMFEFATEMVATRYRREHPDATQAEVDAAVRAWVSDRPGARHGDAEGTTLSWPRPA